MIIFASVIDTSNFRNVSVFSNPVVAQLLPRQFALSTSTDSSKNTSTLSARNAGGIVLGTLVSPGGKTNVEGSNSYNGTCALVTVLMNGLYWKVAGSV